MNANTSNVSYDKSIALSFTNKRGNYGDLSYDPVFRAAALFLAVVNARVNTRVIFMNYWKIKNQLGDGSVLATLRDQDGKRVARRYWKLEQVVFDIDVGEMLGGAADFLGSIEVEIHSAEDLKFAFPAMDVVYETAKGLTYVHTCQRKFNNVEDAMRGMRFNARQSAFDLITDHGSRPFFSVINGARKVEGAAARIEISNHAGALLKHEMTLGDLAPFAAKLVELTDIPGVKDFLGGKPGYCVVDLDANDVFCRLTCGNLGADLGTMSVTHSFYDCRKFDDYYTASDIQCFFPFNYLEGVDVEVIFYPILSPAMLKISLEERASDGSVARTYLVTDRYDGAGNEMLRFNLKDFLAGQGARPGDVLYVLRVEALDGKIPARIPIGLNYHTAASSGTNINTSAMFTTAFRAKQRSYMWGPLPLREGGKNWLMIAHLGDPVPQEATSWGKLTVWIEDEIVLDREIESRHGEAINLAMETLLPADKVKANLGKTAWYVFESPSVAYTGNQIFVSADGHVGGDHSF
jgi:hypothetical protein